MTRARTKVAEWWETSYDRERWNGQCPQRTRVGARTVARVNGGKVFHVTRYRLAPLVKLVWRVDHEHLGELDARTQEDRFGISSALATVRIDGTYDVWAGGAVPTKKAESFAEAKAACAARLLELGYRVMEQ